MLPPDQGPIELTSGADRPTDRLADLYARFQGDSRRVAYLLTGDRELAEDLAQEAFVRASSRLAWLRKPESFEFYLRRTLINLSRGHWRKVRSERQYLESERSKGSDVVTEGTDVEERDVLWRALQTLPYRQRVALILRFYEDMSEQDTAHVMGCPVGTVKSLVSRGLKTLRETLGVIDEY
jgi:RNA polymerase sigma-70 factor (sigma-E family)